MASWHRWKRHHECQQMVVSLLEALFSHSDIHEIAQLCFSVTFKAFMSSLTAWHLHIHNTHSHNYLLSSSGCFRATVGTLFSKDIQENVWLKTVIWAQADESNWRSRSGKQVPTWRYFYQRWGGHWHNKASVHTVLKLRQGAFIHQNGYMSRNETQELNM